MTSPYFQQSKYASATPEKKLKIVQKLTESIRTLIAEVKADSDLEGASIWLLNVFMGIAIGLETKVCNDQRLCRGCFVVSDTINTCQSCWKVQACDYCTDDDWHLQRTCEKCDNAVCWKEECKICEECKNYRRCKECGDRKRIKVDLEVCDDCRDQSNEN